MMSAIEKPKFDKEYFDLLQKKIENNKAIVDEYKSLDDFIESTTGISNYILNPLKELDIYSFQDYIDERKKDFSPLKAKLEGQILGRIIGAISALKRAF